MDDATRVDLDEMPDEIMAGAIEFAMEVRGIPLGEVLEVCRRHALKQFRRERISYLRGRANSYQRANPDREADSYQREHEDEQQFGWAAE